MFKFKLQACAGYAVFGLLVTHGAYGAFGTDNLQVRIGGGLRYDSNIFRLPDGVDAVTPNGTGRSDMIATVNAGATVIVPVSRQQFLFSADLSQANYNKFSNLNFTGQDLRGLWRWQAGPWLAGDLGHTRTKYLSNFATTFGQGPNVRTTDTSYFNANYPFAANWAVNFGAAEARYTNSDPNNRFSDNDTSSRNLGLRYTTGLGNYIGVQGSTIDSRFKAPFIFNGVAFDNSYDQKTLNAVAGWSPSAATQLQGTLGRTRRDPKQAGRPEVSGTTGSILGTWRATAKTALNVEVGRDFGPAVDVLTASSKATTITIAPSWQATAKITVLGTLRRQKRDYSDALVPTIVPGGQLRSDTLDVAGLAVVYTPIDRVVVNLSAQREQRKSNLGGLDYTADSLSATVQYSF